jgi:hypothetical protein
MNVVLYNVEWQKIRSERERSLRLRSWQGSLQCEAPRYQFMQGRHCGLLPLRRVGSTFPSADSRCVLQLRTQAINDNGVTQHLIFAL